MSVLEIPRVYFKGEVSWDPVTTNNYAPCKAPAAYDEDDCDSMLNADTVRAAEVDAFRTAAIDEVVSSGNWNPAGTFRSPFYNTEISGVDTGAGLDTKDPFVSAPVTFTGMLVDCEPYGAYSSQLFFDTMSFGIAGGCRIFGERVVRFTDRYVNFAANPNNNMIAGIASVVWQTCFDKTKGLRIDAHDSAALSALNACMDDDDVLGVMVRFVTYRTVYYDDPTLANRTPETAAAGKAMQEKLRAGGFQPNPARSLLVGTAGIWRRGDPVHEPGDRALLTQNVPISVSINPAIGPAVCGSAWARVGKDRLTLDFSNCIPWAGRAPAKVDIGALTVVAADAPPAVAVTTVATLPAETYNQAAYEATSGIIDIPLEPGVAEQLATMDISIQAEGQTYLQEQALRAIPGDPNLYVDQGDSVQTEVQVYDRGVPAGAGVTVTMSELGASQPTSASQTTDAAGMVTFPLSSSTPTVVGLVFQPGDDPVLPMTDNGFNPQIYNYMYLRVLPAEDTVAKLPPTWDNVHNFVLSNWEAMAPCMDNWLLLGDEAQVRAYGKVIRKLTDPAAFEDFRYMPVTRDLTAGQRTLLYKFLDGAPKEEMAMAAEPDEAATPPMDYGRLSRAMRSS